MYTRNSRLRPSDAGEVVWKEKRQITRQLSVLVLLAIGVVGAAQDSTQNLGEASVAELGKIQVYSASKHMQSASDAPSSVSIVTADQIQEYGYRSLADILGSLQGFYITYDRDYSFVGVRGFGRLGDWNSNILVLIDGHRINDNILGEAFIGTEFPVDVDLIERVEIIRGPSSSLYGADAFFAVINVITRKSPQLKGFELSFAPASFGTFDGRASYGGNFRGLDLLLSGTFYDSHGQTLFYPQFDTPTTNNGITRNTDYENFQHLVATLSYRGFTFQGVFSARDKGVPTAYFGSLFNDPRTRNLDHHQYFDLSYQHSIGEGWDLTARTSYDQARLQAPVAYSTGLPDGSTFVDTYSFRGNWWETEFQLSRTFLEKHRVTLGTEIIDNLRQDQGDYTSRGDIFAATPASSAIWALYVQDEVELRHNVILSAGLRYDHYSGFGGTTNPRLALIYHLFRPTTLKLLYGSAFRAPEPFETEPDFAFFEKNLSLQPETIHSIEGVVEQTLGRQFKLSGNVFQNRIGNLISLETDSQTGQSVYRNSEKADALGMGLEFNGRFSTGLETTVSYSYADAENAVTHKTLSNAPRQLAKWNVAVPLLQRRLFAALDAQYTGPRLTLAGNTVGGFATFNATLLAHTLGKHMDLSVSIYNLLDKKYFDPGRPEDVQDSIEQDGRSFRIKLTGRF